MLEVVAAGRYFLTQWIRNGNPRFLPSNAPNVVHFGEIYYAENTTVADLGLYEVELVPAPDTDSQAVGLLVAFAVILPGNEVTLCSTHDYF